MTNGSQGSAIFISFEDDGADCISDISSLYNPKEDTQTGSYGGRAGIETGRLTSRGMDQRTARQTCAEGEWSVRKEESTH